MHTELEAKGKAAKAAAARLSVLSSKTKNSALCAMADALEEN